MNIWIDGDACPKVIKQILFRAAMKRNVLVTIVANHLAFIPPSAYIRKVKVEPGFDKADKYIVSHLQIGDLVVTADIVLAHEVVMNKGIALNPRGMLYTENNINQVLNLRHMNESLREGGLIKGGIASLNPKEIQQFSNHLDRMITTSNI